MREEKHLLERESTKKTVKHLLEERWILVEMPAKLGEDVAFIRKGARGGSAVTFDFDAADTFRGMAEASAAAATIRKLSDRRVFAAVVSVEVEVFVGDGFAGDGA